MSVYWKCDESGITKPGVDNLASRDQSGALDRGELWDKIMNRVGNRQFAIPAKTLKALFTFVWFFPCMSSLMSRQVTRFAKTLKALFTFVWFFPCMSSLMPRQDARLAKTLKALFTFVWFSPV